MVGDAPSFIDDKSGVPFDSEYFSTEGSALAGGGADRVFTLVISEIICKNAGGTTRALEVWDLGVDHNKAPYREYTVYSY